MSYAQCHQNSFSVSGGDTEGETGFEGCIRKLVVQGDPVFLTPDIKNTGGVVNGTCSVQDRSGHDSVVSGGFLEGLVMAEWSWEVFWKVWSWLSGLGRFSGRFGHG